MKYYCPKPKVWNEIFETLCSYALSAASDPPKPLILGGWVHSSAKEKHERWQETITWAEKEGIERYVKNLSPDDFEYWNHDEPVWSPESK